MKRVGMMIHLKPGSEDRYRALHRAAWPQVLRKILECRIRNYSIYLKGDVLFSYFEYYGEDFAADMARMAADPTTQQWWAEIKPLQQPLATRKEGEWWAEMDEVFHLDGDWNTLDLKDKLLSP
jgi:L-rhamnose mutarotase